MIDIHNPIIQLYGVVIISFVGMGIITYMFRNEIKQSFASLKKESDEEEYSQPTYQLQKSVIGENQTIVDYNYLCSDKSGKECLNGIYNLILLSEYKDELKKTKQGKDKKFTG